MKKQSVMQKPKENVGMLQIQVLFNRVLQREDSLVSLEVLRFWGSCYGHF